MVISDLSIGAETIVRAGPYPLDDITEADFIDSRSEVKHADKDYDFNSVPDKIDVGTLSSDLSRERMSINNLEEPKIKEDKELFLIDDLAYEKGLTRLHKLIGILIRNETIDFLTALNKIDNENSFHMFNLMLKSKNHLHTFTDLVSEDLISLKDNRFVLTELSQRLITNIIEGQYD